MKKYLITTAALLSLSACGTTTVIREVTATTQQPKETVVITVPVQETTPTNKYTKFYDHVMENSGQAQTWDKSNIIELGDLICGALDDGNSVASVIELLESNSDGSSDTELFASLLVGAISYICPEYVNQMENYIN